MKVKECPNCGASAKLSERKCGYCKAEFFITSLAYLTSFDSQGVGQYIKHYKGLVSNDSSDTEAMLGLGLCYLHTGLYPMAENLFEQVIDDAPEVSQAYYYFAISNIRGRRLKTLTLSEARHLESYLKMAIQLEGNIPQYKLLLAMLKRDYYETNGLRVPDPTATQLLLEISDLSINKIEADRLHECVIVSNKEFYFNSINIE